MATNSSSSFPNHHNNTHSNNKSNHDEDDDGFYRASSPDLTTPADEQQVHPQHQQYRGSISLTSPYTPTGVGPSSGFGSGSGGYFAPRTPSATPVGGPGGQAAPFFRRPSWGAPLQQGFGASGGGVVQGQQAQQVQLQPQQPPVQTPTSAFSRLSFPQSAIATQNPHQFPTHYSPAQPHSQSHFVKSEDSDGSMPRPRRSANKREVKYEDPSDEFEEEEYVDPHNDVKPKFEGMDESSAVEEERDLPEGTAGVDVRTKFPVARIKRIMQADEDVGKVAQVTPVVVSKALELFMISLVTKSATEAKRRGQKRVTASHLKQAVMSDEQFDFLHDIVSKVPDAPPPGAAAGGRESSEG